MMRRLPDMNMVAARRLLAMMVLLVRYLMHPGTRTTATDLSYVR